MTRRHGDKNNLLLSPQQKIDAETRLPALYHARFRACR